MNIIRYYGSALYFYDGSGSIIGDVNLEDYQYESEDSPDGKESRRFWALNISSSYVPVSGGIICLYGSRYGASFTHVVAYGTTTASQLFTFNDCFGARVDEDISDFTKVVPSNTQSYQKQGYGLEYDDFVWGVAKATLERENVNQDFPYCNDVDVCYSNSEDGFFFFSFHEKYYTIHWTGPFGNCFSMCVSDFWFNFYRLFGWECGECN